MAETQNTENIENSNTTNENGPPPSSDNVDGARTQLCQNRLQRRRQFRLSTLNRRHGQWTCFLFCHVRTGTIVIGLWNIYLQMVALSLIGFVVYNPEVVVQSLDRQNGGHIPFKQMEVHSVNCTDMPCLLATQNGAKIRGFGKIREFNDTMDYPAMLQNLLAAHRIDYDDINLGIFITCCFFVVTLALINGAIRRQPSHLMPFFFIQVFDFCISSMTMLGHLSSLSNLTKVVKDLPIVPIRNVLLSMNQNCLVLFVMMIFMMTLIVKAYCISIIWRCYKYLMLRTTNPDLTSGMTGPVDQESQTLVLGHDLPDYNTAMTDPQYRKKVPGLFPDPPPSYDMAMASQHVALPPESSGNASGTMPLLQNDEASTPTPSNSSSVVVEPPTSSSSSPNI